MGAVASRKKKALAVSKNASVKTPMPPKPLTAVSEGEEQAWSSAHVVEEDKDDDALPKPPKKNMDMFREKSGPENASSAMSTSTSDLQSNTRIDSVASVEEKEDTPSAQQNSASAYSMVEEKVEYSEPASTEQAETSYAPSTQVDEVKQEAFVEPPREPTPDPLQEGGYLLFSTTNDGTLYLQYSHHKVEHAIAYFKPNKVVPAFKYRQNHGRVELIRKLMSNKQAYFDGYADFLKAAKEFDSEVYIIQHVAQVYYLIDGSKVVEAPMETFFSTRVQSVAVIPPNNTSFEGVRHIHPDQFVSTGNKYGKALKF